MSSSNAVVDTGGGVAAANGEEPSLMEEIPSEVEDSDSTLTSYEILTYPADYTLEVLVDKWNKGDIEIPKFQRRFVWNQNQASKLIDSFLKGLPVPSIFLFSDLESNKLLVVDGQQRLLTLAFFFEGYFGEERSGKRSIFRLTGLEDDSPYNGLTYESLQDANPKAFSRLNDSVLRSFVIRQLDPADDTSIYHVFERLNTGGTLLRPQEIRNCLNHGKFNDMLIEANLFEPWRRIFGSDGPQKRQRDVEVILRFLALYENSDSYEKPMKDFLNQFMKSKQNADDSELKRYYEVFKSTASIVSSQLGPKPFNIRTGLNVAVLDSVFIAIARRIDRAPSDLKRRYDELISDENFLSCVSSGTTDREVISRRIAMAEAALD